MPVGGFTDGVGGDFDGQGGRRGIRAGGGGKRTQNKRIPEGHPCHVPPASGGAAVRAPYVSVSVLARRRACGVCTAQITARVFPSQAIIDAPCKAPPPERRMDRDIVRRHANRCPTCQTHFLRGRKQQRNIDFPLPLTNGGGGWHLRGGGTGADALDGAES